MPVMGSVSGCGCGDSGVSRSCGDSGTSRNCGDSPVGAGIFSNMGDSRGMGLRLNQKGAACGQEGQSSGLFSRLKARCGGGNADGGGEVVTAGLSDCGCGDSEVVQCGGQEGGGGLFGKFGSKGGCGGGGCLFGKFGKSGGCGASGCGAGGHFGGHLGGRFGGRLGSHGKLSKLKGARNHPYGGAIPHTAMGAGGIGPGTGTAPSYAYPYYTTRGPRDFLMKNPPSIGY